MKSYLFLRNRCPLCGQHDAHYDPTKIKKRRSQNKAMTTKPESEISSPLVAYSAGRMSTRVACRKLGLRDGSELLIALGHAGLEMPAPPHHVVEQQVEDFERLWKETS